MVQHSDFDDPNVREVIVVGGGIAGLSAAIYLGRAQRDTLVIDSGHSMAKWEPVVENYLGFPRGVGGEELLKNGRAQAEKHEVRFVRDEIKNVSARDSVFVLKGKKKTYRTKRLLLATGIFHLPPEIPGVKQCLGHSMFFCKDCDGYRVREKRIAIVGANNEAVEYALGMLHYSACVIVATNGDRPRWDKRHARWLEEYEIPVARKRICDVEHRKRKIRALEFGNGESVKIDYLFTTRGDIFHNQLAKKLGAKIDSGRPDQSRPMHAHERAAIVCRGLRHARELPDDYRRRPGRRRGAGDQSRSVRREPRHAFAPPVSGRAARRRKRRCRKFPEQNGKAGKNNGIRTISRAGERTVGGNPDVCPHDHVVRRRGGSDQLVRAAHLGREGQERPRHHAERAERGIQTFRDGP